MNNTASAASAATPSQLPLGLLGIAGIGSRPEKGVYREVLRLTGMSGTRNHVGWLLYGRSNSRGRVPPVSYADLAADGGISVSTVKRGVLDGERRGAWRRRGRRTKAGGLGANGYVLNLGGLFPMATPPRVTQTLGGRVTQTLGGRVTQTLERTKGLRTKGSPPLPPRTGGSFDGRPTGRCPVDGCPGFLRSDGRGGSTCDGCGRVQRVSASP